jgi:hypothetical protein
MMGVNLRFSKGVVPGKDWDVTNSWQYCVSPIPVPCIFPWGTAVVSSDGGVLPCRGAFYREDDMGRIGIDELSEASFRAVWNGPRFQAARRLFRGRDGTAAERELVCFNCPNTTTFTRWQEHCRNGGTAETFTIGYTLNDIWNYFWNRRPNGADRHHPDGRSDRGRRRVQ